MAAPTTIYSFAVGQRLKAGPLNLAVTAIQELQPPNGFTTGTLGGPNPIASYGYRIHGWQSDTRIVVSYTAPPGTLTLNVTSIPSAVYPQNSGVASAMVLCYGSVGGAGTRWMLPCFLSTGGSLQVRGGATNPNNLDTFEVQAVYSIA